MVDCYFVVSRMKTDRPILRRSSYEKVSDTLALEMSDQFFVGARTKKCWTSVALEIPDAFSYALLRKTGQTSNATVSDAFSYKFMRILVGF